jgi:hypothetical protein
LEGRRFGNGVRVVHRLSGAATYPSVEIEKKGLKNNLHEEFFKRSNTLRHKSSAIQMSFL